MDKAIKKTPCNIIFDVNDGNHQNYTGNYSDEVFELPPLPTHKIRTTYDMSFPQRRKSTVIEQLIPSINMIHKQLPDYSN